MSENDANDAPPFVGSILLWVAHLIALVYLRERAKSKGVEVNRLVNDMLKRDIDLIEAVK